MDDANSSYKLIVENRDYSKYTYNNMEGYLETSLDICPIVNKMFNHDVFTISSDKTPHILHSMVRSSTNIPGVIILKNNKTYGRHTNGKLLYKCIPDDNRLPVFLIPYQMKNMGFSKDFVNIYITFSVVEWKSTHPYATINQIVGPVNQLENYFEYQLYCKSLNASIQQFNKKTIKVINKQNHEDLIEQICKNNPMIEDRTGKEWYIFTIDPIGSLDYDDAFSIKTLDDEMKMISIYISNVTLWLDMLNLWQSFSKRISTIYLPDRKRPMLPTILSECLCSLLENKSRMALVLDMYIDKNFQVYDINYMNVKIKVSKNYSYEEKLLIDNTSYQELLFVTTQLSKTYKYTNHIHDSHDVVAYLMIFMNCESAKIMLNNKNGILRSSILNKKVIIPHELPEDVNKFIKMWNSSSGQYIDTSSIQDGDVYNHDLMELEAYIHITSPIRRIIDLLNMIQLQININISSLSEDAIKFYNNWIAQLEYINTTMRSIRKVQNDCSLLHKCITDPTTLDIEYDGYLFDKMKRNDGLFHYIVYLPKLKLTSKIIIREEFDNFQQKVFKLFVFQDEDRIKRKIRLQLVSNM